ENIALANNGGPSTVNSTPPTAVSGWMASNGHRKNILNGAFGRTGMGIAVSSAGDVLFTQLFAD
ncbi:MAG: SCP-like extracellular protein, partial [Candidatus Hydrogenedentes bacterium]|nr:SCP-like extracellular protein [Candidatus Hydrogenedentota bacterium]